MSSPRWRSCSKMMGSTASTARRGCLAPNSSPCTAAPPFLSSRSIGLPRWAWRATFLQCQCQRYRNCYSGGLLAGWVVISDVPRVGFTTMILEKAFGAWGGPRALAKCASIAWPTSSELLQKGIICAASASLVGQPDPTGPLLVLSEMPSA